MRRRGYALALAAAALFGAGAPIAKLLLGTVSPLLLSALLYLGAGGGLVGVGLFRRSREAALSRAELPRLLLSAACGGVLAPLLLLVGLGRLPGPTGALALGIELPMTALLAVLFFGDSLGRREVLGIAVIFLGGVCLAVGPGALSARPDALGLGFVACACALWGLDNNLTQTLSAKDPVAISRVKGLVAGSASLAIAFASGAAKLPPWTSVAGGLALGFASYGLSLVCFTGALRNLGAARTGAVFAAAPFLGALFAVPLLGTPPSIPEWIGGAVMALGVALVAGSRHEHAHVHEPMEHEHVHVHDPHHRHEHAPDAPPGEPHSHPHVHERLEHSHPHLPDLHHRHGH